MSYRVLYADPPWRFATYSTKGRGRCPDGEVGAFHYDTMSLADIKALPVASIAAPDSALLLWATDPCLPQALEVMAAWGFTYKTVGFTWVKRTRADTDWHLGCGYWTRANPEMCLLGTRGRPKRLSRSVRQLIVAPVREHSRKPVETYERIEALLKGPYVELFARTRRPGWDVAFSPEAGKFKAAA